MSSPVAKLGDGVIEVRCKYDYTPFLQQIKARWDPIKRCWELPVSADGLSRARRIAGILVDRAVTEAVGAEDFLPPDAPAPGAELPVKATPYAHQRAGYKRAMDAMKDGGGYALLFEQGCGKTLTAIGIIGGVAAKNRGHLKVLILAPLSVVPVWPEEFAKYAGYTAHVTTLLQKPVYKRIQSLKDAMDWEGVNAFVTNYDSIRSEDLHRALVDGKFDMVVCDESQRIKAHDSQVSKICGEIGLHAKYRLILTGTPIGNTPLEVWAQWRFLLPSVFNKSYYAFRNRYAVLGGFNGHQVIGYNHLDELMQLMAGSASRVLKRDALDLPEYVDQTLYCDMEPAMKKKYDTFAKEAVLELSAEKTVTAPMVITRLLRLAQFAGGYVEHELIHRSKLNLYEDTLRDLLDAGHKVVVFARFVDEVKELYEIADGLGACPAMIYGDVDGEERGELVKRFQTDPECRVFVAQIRTAGLGITLHAADVSIFYSTGFSLIDYLQARDRIHRVGQKNACTCIHLTVRGTVDEETTRALEAKQDMAATIVDSWREIVK